MQSCWVLVSSLAVLTWLLREKQQVRTGVTCCPCPFPASLYPPPLPVRIQIPSEPPTTLFLIYEMYASGRLENRPGSCHVRHPPMRELAQLGTGAPLQEPLPGPRSCLVTPSPDDRSSMSRGSAKEQQGHL